MNPAIRRLGPLASVLAAAGWLCWEHVACFDTQPVAEPENTVQINRKLLAPSLPPPIARNPLAPVIAKVAAPPEQAQASEEAIISEAEVEKLVAKSEAANRPAATSQAAKSPPPGTSELEGAYKLRGTFVGSRRKSALINDQLCFEGGPAPPVAMLGAASCILLRVEANRVVLVCGKQEFALTYNRPAAEKGGD